MEQIKQVQEFNDLFHIAYKDKPELSTTWGKRIGFLQEELDELRDAHENNDLVEVADAYCDLLYFLIGGVLDNGLQHVFVDLFNIVQESNMSKACLTIEEADATVEDYLSKGIDTYYEKSGDKYLVYRTDTMKVQKNINYKKVDFSEILS